METSKEKVKEELEEEININFTIQMYKIIIEKKIGPSEEYYKIRINIKEPKLLPEGEIKYEQIWTELFVKNVLRDIAKLHKIYKYTNNEKLAEGAKEEILKQIAFLIWTLGWYYESRK